MKTLRHLCLAVALTSAFAVPALADEIECGIQTPPPPPSASSEAAEETGETEGITADVLSALLNGLLTVL